MKLAESLFIGIILYSAYNWLIDNKAVFESIFIFGYYLSRSYKNKQGAKLGCN